MVLKTQLLYLPTVPAKVHMQCTAIADLPLQQQQMLRMRRDSNPQPLALETAAIPGYKISFHLYTVPGQIVYNATMQLVLHQADGVVFVADSQIDRQRDNLQAMQNLEANLRLNGRSIDSIPLVLQYNKRDLSNLAPVEYMEFLLNNRSQRCPSFAADALSGRNVLATLNAVSTAVLQRFQSRIVESTAAAVPQQTPTPTPPVPAMV